MSYGKASKKQYEQPVPLGLQAKPKLGKPKGSYEKQMVEAPGQSVKTDSAKE